MFDLAKWVKESTEKSGVPEKVRDKNALLTVAGQVKRKKERTTRAALPLSLSLCVMTLAGCAQNDLVKW